jgi:hypothetical protein
MREDDSGKYISADGVVVPLAVFIKDEDEKQQQKETEREAFQTVRGLSACLYREIKERPTSQQRGVLRTRKFTRADIEIEMERMVAMSRKQVFETLVKSGGTRLTSKDIATTLGLSISSVTASLTRLIRFLDEKGMIEISKKGLTFYYKMKGGPVANPDVLYAEFLERERVYQQRRRADKNNTTPKAPENEAPKSAEDKTRPDTVVDAMSTDALGNFIRQIVEECLKDKPLLNIQSNTPTLNVNVDVNVRFGFAK